MSEFPSPLQVALAGRSYPIHVGSRLEALIAAELAVLQRERRGVAVVVDAAVAGAQAEWLEVVFGGLPRIEIPSGEGSKCFTQLERVCDFLAAQRIDRSGVIIAIGGGVTGDLAGFAAASYLRGIRFYQVPTTLLAMVDSSVGGKTGINLRAGKNLVGAFLQPRGVFADVERLRSLPAREFNSGMAEVIKHGMLAEAALFTDLEALAEPLHPGHPELAGIVRRNCAIKAAVVQADETEKAQTGGRALLNLGHTFGHAIEAVAGYGTYLHGEAISIGLVLAARLSARLGMVEPELTARVTALVGRYALPARLEAPLPVGKLRDAMMRDKKVRGGQLRMVGLRALGEAVTLDRVDLELIETLWLEAGAE